MMLNDVEPMTITERWWSNDELRMLSWMISTRGEQDEIHPWKVSRDVKSRDAKTSAHDESRFKPEDDKRAAEVEEK